jgi:hypothetical protein
VKFIKISSISGNEWLFRSLGKSSPTVPEDIFCAKWLENYCAGALNNLAKQDITLLRSELAVVLTDPRSSLSCFRAKLISWSALQIARDNMLFHSAIALLRHWGTR